MMNRKSFAVLLTGSFIFVANLFAKTAEEKIFDIELLNGKLLSPKTLQVKRYDKIGLRVKSNEAGELHLHAYRIKIPVSASKISEYYFVAEATGKFKLEWHSAVQSRSNHEIGHHEPLAFLEVYPQ